MLDATYTPEEYPRFVRFGHSTWEQCGALCAEAGISHRELCRRSGVSYAALKTILRGDRQPRRVTLRALSQELTAALGREVTGAELLAEPEQTEPREDQDQCDEG